jgi:hypothetical protein
MATCSGASGMQLTLDTLEIWIRTPYWPLSGTASSADFEARLWDTIG